MSVRWWVLAAALVLSTPARAELVFEQRLATEQPGARTGARVHVVYPSGADGRPKQVVEAIYDFPRGTRIDEASVPVCPASDSEFNARGLDACPPETRLGGGDLTAATGCGPGLDPLATDIHSFHGPHQVVNVFTPHGSTRPVLSVARIQIESDRVIDRPTLPPGCPPPNGRSAPREVHLEVTRPFFVAPPECGPRHRWTSHVAMRFTDGSDASANSAGPCVVPSMRLSVAPRRVRAGRPVRLRARVRSSSAACRSGVVVRFGNRRFVTDSQGRALLTLTLHRTGLREIGARKPGCRTAFAQVRVLPRR